MVEELGRWLEELGLGTYAEAFSANGVAWDVLADLTEKDLETLGVSPGDRKRLLRALAALDGPAPPLPQLRRPIDGAERRQITVMFVDLLDSTPISRRLAPAEVPALRP